MLKRITKTSQPPRTTRSSKGMDMDREVLAGYRVRGSQRLKWRAVEMDEAQRSERRIYLRSILDRYPQWENLSNDSLDAVRLCRAGKGFILEDSSGNEFFLPDGGVTKEETDFRKARAMMPFDFMDKTGKDFSWGCYAGDVSKTRNMVNQYILKFREFQKEGYGLYISSGTKGSGKTMLSCCLINEISARYGIAVKFVNILDFLEMTKKSFRGEGDGVDALYQAGLLVVDDIGVQMPKDWVDTALYRLINDRYVNRRPTVYTSNTAVDNLRMDDRITDRIDSTTYSVALPEESIRRAMRQQDKERKLAQIRDTP